MMRVAIDARWAQTGQYGGVARAIRSIVPRLADRVEFTAIVDSRWGPVDLGVDVPTIAVTLPVRAPALTWLNLRLPFVLRSFDGIFYEPFNFLPMIRTIPSVVTIHDLSFETHPHLFPGAKAQVYRAQARAAARRAAHVTTVTEWSRNDIIERYGVDPARIHVVPNGVEPAFRPLDSRGADDLQRRAGTLGITLPYVLAFGGTRRGTPMAIEAWRRLRREGHAESLVIVDEAGPTEPGLARVMRPAQADLRLLVAGATLLLYPTETESFGMPALECAASGTPVVAPPVGALPEVLDDAAAWCERNATSLADVAGTLLSDPDRLAHHSARGIEVAKGWTWDEAARRLFDVYAWTAAG
jgi:glycosyltransferase involved in cell wall biosynthesis